MKFFKLLICTLLISLVTLPTGGQSLVMSGNEIFEQESIPKKSKNHKNKETEQKSLKQKGAVNIPALRKNKTNNPQQPSSTQQQPKEMKNDKKPKVTTLSTVENTESAPLFNFLMQIFLMILYSFV